MCNAYNLRHCNEAILNIARAMQLEVADRFGEPQS